MTGMDTRAHVAAGFIHVDEPGALTIVQDLGRWEHTNLGIPICGPMDPFAFAAANALGSNEPGAAELELTALGPTLTVEADCFISICGGDLGPRISGATVECWKAHYVSRGTEVSFSGRRSGARAYLAISGGIGVDPWLGSRSTYLRAGVGGFSGRALRVGDKIPVAASPDSVSVQLRALPADGLPRYSDEPVLRVILGPHLDNFSEVGLSTFLEGKFRLSRDADRMGYRLDGPPIAHSSLGPDVSSCGIPFGAIQVPGDGRPILLMADHPTAGGYALVAVVIQADLPIAAQCLPGDTVRFQAVEPGEAREALRTRYEVLEDLRSRRLTRTTCV